MWIGRTDTDWDTAFNWAGGSAPPGTDKDVTISSGPNSLNISDTSRTVNHFTIESGATVYVANSKMLTTNGTFDNNGTLSIGAATVDANGEFDAAGGSVTFTGAGDLKLGGATITSLGTFSEGNGTVWYDRAGGQTVLSDIPTTACGSVVEAAAQRPWAAVFSSRIHR